MESSNELTIRIRPNPTCIVCGSQGVPLYTGLQDRQSSSPQEWRMMRCVNDNCQLHFLDPVPHEDDLILAYHEDYYTHGVQQRDIRRPWTRTVYIRHQYGYDVDKLQWWQQVLGVLGLIDFTRKTWLDRSVAYLPACPGGRLVEVGFGSGEMLRELARLGWRVEGVEFDAVAVEVAKTKGLDVHKGSLLEQEYPDDSIDAILISHVIEHVYDPTKLLSECRRILKPGGMLIVFTPNNTSLSHRVFRQDCWLLEPPRHLQFFGVKSMSKVLDQAGLRNREIFTTTHNVRGYFIASLQIRESSRYSPAKRVTLGMKLQSIGFYMLERAMLWIDPGAGEELVAIARK
ncbi:MAG: class I SAM-dependent methyltransferase [Chloroflexi bacterium]|nr:class I SAM-dependent methyltransferase [Chloroflexota bacterium]